MQNIKFGMCRPFDVHNHERSGKFE
jgi:hypothetical protein